MKKIVIIHTSFVSKDALIELFAAHCPGVKVHNIVDDSLLEEVSAAGGMTEGVKRRMKAYVEQAASLAPDLILNQCSSVGEAFEEACANIPYKNLRIDAPMAELAALLCPAEGKIAVIATIASTVQPSLRLARQKADQTGKKITVTPILIDGALNVLMKEGNRAKHDLLVTSAVEEACKTHDVIILAQGSMMEIGKRLANLPKPVLTSPALAVDRARGLLGIN